MDYNKRTMLIGGWLRNVLKRYRPPPEMDDDALRQELNFIVEDINSIVPAGINEGQFNLILEGTDKKVRMKQTSRTWPTIKAFTEAAKKSLPSSAGTTNTGPTLDPLKIAAKRIKAGKEVGESYIFGRNRQLLLEQELVTEEELAHYTLPLLQ